MRLGGDCRGNREEPGRQDENAGSHSMGTRARGRATRAEYHKRPVIRSEKPQSCYQEHSLSASWLNDVMVNSPSMRSLAAVNQAITECRHCPRLVAYRETVAAVKRRQYREWIYWGRPVPGFGDPAARLFIIGLAPAAHGGNRTGRIFTGDRSGDWLYDALHRHGFANQPQSIRKDDGLMLTDCYIAAVVRCAPPDNKPTLDEFNRCRPYLLEELRLLTKHRVVVTLGKIAFDQYLRACRELGHTVPSPALRFGHGVLYRLPWGVTLIGSYHPSQQNTFTGKLTTSMFFEVFERARRIIADPNEPRGSGEVDARVSRRRPPRSRR